MSCFLIDLVDASVLKISLCMLAEIIMAYSGLFLEIVIGIRKNTGFLTRPTFGFLNESNALR